MELRNPLRTAAVLFDGQADGQWTLPEQITEARDALRRVQDLIEELPPPPDHPTTVRDRLAFQVAAGADLNGTPVHEARQALANHEDRVALLRAAREVANQRLATALGEHASRTLTEHLAPAFDSLVDSLRRDFTTARHVDSVSPPAVVLSQPKNVRDAIIRIDGSVGRYAVLRDAFNVVRRLAGEETADGMGYFAEVRDAETVWPELAQSATQTRYAPGRPPWMLDSTRDRLAWMFAHGAEPWMPTAQQQTDRYMEVFGEKLRKAQIGRSQLNGLRSIGEGASGDSARPMSEQTAAVHGRLFGTRGGVEVNGGAVE